MVQVTFRSDAGEVRTIEAKAGDTLMRSAKDQDVQGIVAECGGSQVCGTCLVYVDEPWFSRLAEPNELEAEMVEYAMHPRPNGRLSCQIVVTPDLEGMSVQTPVSQR